MSNRKQPFSGLPVGRRAYLRGLRRTRLRTREFAHAHSCLGELPAQHTPRFTEQLTFFPQVWAWIKQAWNSVIGKGK